MATTFDPAAFKADIYAGGMDDTQATKRGLEIAKQQGWSPVQTVDNWNKSLGTDFGVQDFFRGLDEAGMTNAADFGQYMYKGGNADDKLATRRGLDYAQQVGWTPQQTATNWNDALGTDFGVADLWAAAKGQDVPNDRGQGGGSYLISALRGFSPTGASDPGMKFYANRTIPSGTPTSTPTSGGMVPGAPVQSGTNNAPKFGDTAPTQNIFNPTVTVMPPVTDAGFSNPDAFVNEIYAGGANDTEATKNGLLLAQDFGWSPVETANNWNNALGTEFGAGDYYRAMDEAGLLTDDIFDFGDYMYDSGKLNDSEATVRGLQYAQQQGWAPEQTVQEWNSALGTEFTLDDLNAAMALHNMQSGGGGKPSVYDTPGVATLLD